jgi:DNA modification methylase
MTVIYEHDGVTVILGDAREKLTTMIPDESVQCVVTSPPYYGLRDYGVDGQIGLEPSLDEFLDALLDVFAEVHRVLRPDGTLWLNMGDSYVSSGSGSRNDKRWPKQSRNTGSTHATRKLTSSPLAPKNLMGVPWRLAFALQDAGWILRQEIIWSKPNPMPESVRDRCTKSHEHLFLLTKSPRYYYDADAIREPARHQDPEILATNAQARQQARIVAKKAYRTQDSYRGAMSGEREKGRGKDQNSESMFSMREEGRNKRSVWTISPEPTSDAHFATFPEALVEPCVLAGSRPGDLVLDPFAGSGTTLHVAYRLERRAIGIELNPDYLPLITKPLCQQVLRLEVTE